MPTSICGRLDVAHIIIVIIIIITDILRALMSVCAFTSTVFCSSPIPVIPLLPLDNLSWLHRLPKRSAYVMEATTTVVSWTFSSLLGRSHVEQFIATSRRIKTAARLPETWYAAYMSEWSQNSWILGCTGPVSWRNEASIPLSLFNDEPDHNSALREQYKLH